MRLAARLNLALLLALGLWINPAFGQRDLGTILGTVSDVTGAVIPGADVTITEDAAGLRYEVQTNQTGNYIRPALRPGIYSVAVEAAGFKRSMQSNIRLEAGARAQANFSLEIGDVTETIEVTSTPPALQTETPQMGGTLEGRQTSELPLGGQRRFAFLARQVPAVVPAEPGARDAAGGGFSANGVRSNGQNNFLLNGVDNNVNVIDFINQTAYVIGPSVEAIGEMQILTNGYNAEYGRAAGGVVNVNIKSGTNQVHGVLFHFLQNSAANANTWEANRNANPKANFIQNQFGAAVGGPLVKDRTFWFANYQGTRIRDGALSSTLTIPTAQMRGGDFSQLLTTRQLGTDQLGNPVFAGQIYDSLSQRTVNGVRNVRDPFPNNMIPQSRFDPIAHQLINQYPAENQNITQQGLRPGSNYFIQRPATVDVDQGDVRIDHRISSKDTLFGSLSWSEERKFQTPPLPGDLDGGGFLGETEENLGRNAMMSYTRIWSPSVVTETRAAFTRLVTERVGANAGRNTFQELGIGGLNPFTATTNNGGLSAIALDGYNNVGGSNWLPTKEFNNVTNLIQNVSWNRGRHAFKGGAEYRLIRFPFFQVPSSRGQFNFNRAQSNQPGFGDTGDGIATWLTGLPGTGSHLTSTNFVSSFRHATSFYFQDDWRVTSRFTLNLGMRYEITSPVGEEIGRQANMDIHSRPQATLVIPRGKDQDAPLPPNFATDFPNIVVERGVADKFLHEWDRTNFAPRVGFAYEAMPGTVFRGAYGIFYGAEENEGGSPNRGINLPFNQHNTFNQVVGTDLNPFIPRFSSGFPLDAFTGPAQISFRASYPFRRWPLVHKWNFNIQRNIGWNTIFEAGYIGSKGQRLTVNYDPNRPVNDPDPNANRALRRPIQSLGDNGLQETSNFGRSNYHALTAKLEKRFSDGVQFLTAYTWGHALTDVGTTLAGGPGRRDNDISAEYAHANFDIRHRFTTSGLWELPIGRGKRIGSNWGPAANAVLGGWQMNGIVTFQTGNYFNLGTINAVCACGTTRPDLVPGRDPNNAPQGGRRPEEWFDTSAVQDPTPGTFGNLGNYSNIAPGIANLDLSLFKDFPINERMKIQFRAEAFNLTNTPQFGNPNGNQGAGAFGQIFGTRAGTQRQTQFALRFMF